MSAIILDYMLQEPFRLISLGRRRHFCCCTRCVSISGVIIRVPPSDWIVTESLVESKVNTACISCLVVVPSR